MAESIDQKIKRLTKEYQESVKELHQAEGALESDLKRLKTEFGYSDIPTAERAHETMVKKIEKMEEELDSILTEIDQALEQEG